MRSGSAVGDRGAHAAWSLCAAAGLAIGAVGVARWVGAIAAHAPILYGEGAVANAALLARDRLEYLAPAAPRIFVAANYPPLYLWLAGLGDPFVAGRVASVVAVVVVAAAIAWRARERGVLVAAALALAWLASVPVLVWGPALKPDLVALAFTVVAVLAAERRRPLAAGVLIAVAAWSKPTELLVAIALLASLSRDRAALGRMIAGGLLASAVVLAATWSDPGAMFEHVVVWNTLPWHPEQAALLLLLLVLVFGAPVLAYAIVRPRGTIAAYAIAAAGIVLLGGREGATMNYLLDLITAATLGVAAADRLAARPLVPLLIGAQIVVGLVVVDPFGYLASRAVTSGAWAPSSRASVVRALPGDLLVEDAGLLVADGRTPAVDDLFLLSRLIDRVHPDEGDRVLAAIRAGAFAAVVSEADLSRIETAPAYERQRWHPELVSAVLSRYRLSSERDGLYVYEPASP